MTEEGRTYSLTCFEGVIYGYLGSVRTQVNYCLIAFWHAGSVAYSNNPILPVQAELELFVSH